MIFGFKKVDIETDLELIRIEQKFFQEEFQLHTQMPHNKKGIAEHSLKQDWEKAEAMEQNLARTKGQLDKIRGSRI